MKNTALRKEIILLAATGLVITGLVVYTVISLVAGDQKGQFVLRLNESLNAPIQLAQNNWISKKEGKSINLENDVISHLTTAKTILTNLYEGKPVVGVEFEKPKSEDRKALIKLSQVAIDQLAEHLNTMAEEQEPPFSTVRSSIQNLIKDYERTAASSWHGVISVAWITLGLTVVFIISLIVWAYRKMNGFYTELSDAKLKVTGESQRVDQLSAFIEAMASGNYDMSIEARDELSTTLISMRDKLRSNFVEEQRRNWSTTGLAKIGEILRSTGKSSELYDRIIQFLVKYTNSNQGGLFILDDSNEEEAYLNLVACYAFERKKFLTKKLSMGEGLVGQCFLEEERIHLTEIPEDYIRITSGLGGESPTSCLLVPLKVNDKVFGVIELASFKLYPEHVVELVEKFAESIASTISNVKINESTRLLLEQTQQQAEEMKSQEEEMRQNMEELSATQEEMHRKEQEYIKRISDLESQLAMAEKV